MTAAALFQPLTLPCGVQLKNRIAKPAMSDSLGDGAGNPTTDQLRLYERWAEGGLGLSIIGEVQGDPNYAEKPGNLVLTPDSDLAPYAALARRGSRGGTQIWPQLGHAGAMAYPPISNPRGPSALDLLGLTCSAMQAEEIEALPALFARTARLAQKAGFGGVQLHAAHGFLLSQFLSPLFNRRTDGWGGSIDARMRPLLNSVAAIRAAVGAEFAIAVKLNATDQLDGGLEAADALVVAEALGQSGIDLLDISGGTYFPGAKSASDASGSGAYFSEFARRARRVVSVPIMLTGGVKTYAQAEHVVSSGVADVVGLARALVLEPSLPKSWQTNPAHEIAFPRFENPPEGGITAWYSMRLTAIAQGREDRFDANLAAAIAAYEDRDLGRIETWQSRFSSVA